MESPKLIQDSCDDECQKKNFMTKRNNYQSLLQALQFHCKFQIQQLKRFV